MNPKSFCAPLALLLILAGCIPVPAQVFGPPYVNNRNMTQLNRRSSLLDRRDYIFYESFDSYSDRKFITNLTSETGQLLEFRAPSSGFQSNVYITNGWLGIDTQTNIGTFYACVALTNASLGTPLAMGCRWRWRKGNTNTIDYNGSSMTMMMNRAGWPSWSNTLHTEFLSGSGNIVPAVWTNAMVGQVPNPGGTAQVPFWNPLFYDTNNLAGHVAEMHVSDTNLQLVVDGFRTNYSHAHVTFCSGTNLVWQIMEKPKEHAFRYLEIDAIWAYPIQPLVSYP